MLFIYSHMNENSAPDISSMANFEKKLSFLRRNVPSLSLNEEWLVP